MVKMKKIFSVFVSFIFAFNLCGVVHAEETITIKSNTPEVPYFEDFEFEQTEPMYGSVEIPVHIENDDEISAQADIFEIFIVRADLKSYSSGVTTWQFNVDCPTSYIDKPNITVEVQVMASFTNETGYYSAYGNPCSKTYTSNSQYGVNYTWTTTAKTGYYYISFVVTDHDNGNMRYPGRTLGFKLYNRTGHEWTFSYNAGDKILPMPNADWIKISPVYRPSGYREYYFREYTRRNTTVLSESLYDVHHIKPLEYGGAGMDYDNLIHLPSALHRKVTGWFNGY